jgi:sulfate adenylyltransferase, large subunit
MVRTSDGIVSSSDVKAYIRQHENKSLLRFIACGSVDDGKSTLIGRLLYESQMVFADHLDAVAADSIRYGTQGNEVDLALLVDGLSAEREQGITIDVAYRFFHTERRKFIVADVPGHEQYTRNMVTGASTADLAIVMIDARKGVLTQSKRHSYIVSLLGVERVVVAVNKMDLVGYSSEIFKDICSDFTNFAARIGLDEIAFIPISALLGDNVVSHSTRTPWYSGPTLMSYLECVEVADKIEHEPFRLQVQGACRPDLDFRGVYGLVVRGSVHPGDAIVILPSGEECNVERIVTMDSDLSEALSGESIVLTFDREVDVSRGDVVASQADRPLCSAIFEANVVWMSTSDLIPGRPYLMKMGTAVFGCKIQKIDHRIDINTLEHTPDASVLTVNEIGVCTLVLNEPRPFDRYVDSRCMGSFILIDRLTNDTVAAGMISSACHQIVNVSRHSTSLSQTDRERLKAQRGTIVWMTGLSGAGKSTIGNELERRLHDHGIHTYLLDGDNVRNGLCRDLDFSENDRKENVRRLAQVASLMIDAGLVVIVCAISPFQAARDAARALVRNGEFIEVYVRTSLNEAEARDPKGLYARARSGLIPDFTGVGSPYEEPAAAEVVIDTAITSPSEAVDVLFTYLIKIGRI